jgi:hypothetical protein
MRTISVGDFAAALRHARRRHPRLQATVEGSCRQAYCCVRKLSLTVNEFPGNSLPETLVCPLCGQPLEACQLIIEE